MSALAYGGDEIAMRILRMGELAAPRVDVQSLERFRADIARQQQLVGDQVYYRDWLALVEVGVDAVRAMLTDRSERGRYLRSVVPLRAFVSRAERDAIFLRDSDGVAAQRTVA